MRIPEPADLGNVAAIMLDVFAPKVAGPAAFDAAWQTDPVGYCRKILGASPWEKQIEIMEAVRDNPRVAVKSGHKIGKSRCAGIIAWWFYDSFPNARVILTSASSRQVRGILWREVRTLYRDAKIKPSTFPPLKVPDPGLEGEDGREIKGFTTDDPERMAGISGENVLFIVDEASGVPPEIFEAIEGNRAGGARVLMLSNPTQTSGEFFDAFHDKRQFYRTISVSSRDTPNVREKRIVIPGLATFDWCQEKLREWGEDSPLYHVRVLGNFPSQSENCVVPLSYIESARARDEDTEAAGRLHLGVDVARYGDDDSIILPRRGNKVLPLECIHGMDTVAVANKTIATLKALRTPGERPVVKVDVIGVGGGVADILRAADAEDIQRNGQGWDVVDVNASSASSSPEEYSNLRAQLHFGVAEWLKAGGALPEDAQLERELLAPTYSFDAQGRRKIEPKEHIKARIGQSPDRADALALAVYNEEVARVVVPTVVPTSRWGGTGRGY